MELSGITQLMLLDGAKLWTTRIFGFYVTLGAKIGAKTAICALKLSREPVSVAFR